MTANIGLRLTLPGGIHVVIRPHDGALFEIEVTDVIGRPVLGEERLAALEYALVNISALREQLFQLLGRRKPTTKAED